MYKQNMRYYYDEEIKKYVFNFLGKKYIIENNEIMTGESIKRLLGHECLISVTTTLFEGFKELHHHDFFEILYIKKGNFVFKVDEKIYNVTPGDIILVSPSTLHVLIQNENNVEAERVVMNVTEKFLDNLSTEQTNLKNVFIKAENNKNYCIHLKNERKKKLESYIDTVLRTQGSTKFGEDILYKIKLSQIFLLLNDEYEDIENTSIISQNKIVTECIEYIDNNISKQFSIDDIANHINVSSSTISHTFKSHTGISIYRFITKKRMILAKKMIKENVNLSEIYQQCGFNDYTSFFRSFKKEFNLTPKEFKNIINQTLK